MPPKHLKTFEEVCESKCIKPDTISKLHSQEYDSIQAVGTLTEGQIDNFDISPAQKGLLKKWVFDLQKPTGSGSVSKDRNVSNEDLKKDQDLNQDINRRLRDLGLLDGASDDEEDEQAAVTVRGKKGSGRNKTMTDMIRHEISWPHYYVFRGPTRSAAAYDNLTIQEFVYGMLCMLQEAKPETQPHMHTLFQELMVDAMEYPWPQVRSFNGVLFQLMEQGRFAWGDPTQPLREQYLRAPAHSHTPAQHKPAYCGPFQSGQCPETAQEHNSPRGMVQHICAYCLRVAGKACAHPEYVCKRKVANQPPEHRQ